MPSSSDAAALLADTTRAQSLASDPGASAWVSANAGAGKTHVLKLRVLRILLAGTPPNRILCLTYTKAAAAEMASRVFDELSGWATAAEADLGSALAKVLSRPATAAETAEARKLFARAIETPGGLKVQTIHAFCERLLQRFPLEAGVPPGFTILDELDAAGLMREATDAVLARATRGADTTLGSALHTIVAFASGDGFDGVLRNALAARDWLSAAGRLTLRDAEGLDAVDTLFRRALGVRAGVTRADLDRELAAVLTEAQLKRAAAALGEGKKTDVDLSTALGDAARMGTDSARIEALERALLTAKFEPRSDARFITKAMREAHPDIHAALSDARDRFAALHLERQALGVVEASLALVVLAGAVMQGYADRKARRAALDFDDLVSRTAGLLSHSGAAEWVLYKLDGGLDHILVDEAQDTSPVQWTVIENLAREFFTGAGARETVRSVFAVGDEKQSIYSFQGAEPRMFAQAGERFRAAAEHARQLWNAVPLTLSFRTVTPLLEAVDRVFADAERTPGVATGAEGVRHVALRLGHAGLVEIWDTEKPDDTEDADPWQPTAEAARRSPVERLAECIAEHIQHWLQTGERLASEDRPIRPGDVLVLLRRRNPFAGPIVSALKSRGIAVAGTDRLRLTEQIAVKDLITLGDFLTLPEDDLALATVLKSPLFDLDDDDLMRIAPARKGSLWSALVSAGRSDDRFAPAAQQLLRWRGMADQSPPFEFYAELLDRDGGRRRMIERLGPEAIDAITEFINLALEFDSAEPPSLTGFLQWLRSGTREIKRDMEHGRDEVRVLTVHGAKGLEAPIVFLPDTCASGSGRQAGELLPLERTGLAVGSPTPRIWPIKGANRVPAVKNARDAVANKESEERNRLLYVAMTRARDRLYVAGWEGSRGRQPDCWYELISSSLDDVLIEGIDHGGRNVRRLVSDQTAAPERGREAARSTESAREPPAWASTQPTPEPRLAIPLVPSRLAPYDIDEVGDPAPVSAAPLADASSEAVVASPLRLAGESRFLRGVLTHALLEHLPRMPADAWDRIAAAFVASRGAALPAGMRASIASETLAVLRAPDFANVFSPLSRAEVPIVAEIPPPSGKGPPLRLNGQVDRLAICDHEVLIVDYKTNRPPPAEAVGVASAYLFQLAAYRLALSKMHPDRPIRAAILWTDGPRLMEIPTELLDRHEAQLWSLAVDGVPPAP
jgi:ATP-dependent helicase/nuclease subunit A